MIFKKTTLVLLGALAVLFCGCVHQEIDRRAESKSQTTLTVTRSGDFVQLSWKSEPGKVYDVLCAEKVGGQAAWKILPGAGNLRGTGDNMLITDSVANGMNRYYRLNISLESQQVRPR
jgi:hypothetical protein